VSQNFKVIPFETESPTIISRDNVTQSLLTRYIVIDSLVSVRYRQRQLIIRNKSSRKTTLVRNIILNQKRLNRYFSPEGKRKGRLFCIYSAIRLRLQKVKSFHTTLQSTGSH